MTEGITPVSSAAGQPQPLSGLSPHAGPPNAGASNPTGGQSGMQAAAGTASSTSLVAHSSTTVTFVNQQVDMMLANVGQGMEHQQALRLMIALLILQQLTDGQQGDSGNNNAMQMLEQMGGGNGAGSSAGLASISSQSTMMQVHHEQTLAYSHQAFQGAAVSHYAEGAGGAPSGQPVSIGMDVTA